MNSNQPRKKLNQSDKSVWIYIGLIAAIIIVYWPVYKYEFITYDDNVYVTANKNVQQGFSPRILKWLFTSDYSSNWHPLTWMSHILDWNLYNDWAGGHHITNVLFHIFNTILLFYFLKKATSSLWPSAFVAAAFALHPLHIESVAWVAERKDVLSTFFWLLTMIAYLYYVKNSKIKWYAAAITLFILGLMSKPMVVSLPFVLLLLDYWPFEMKFSKRLIIEKIPFFILSAASSVITFIFQQRTGAVTEVKSFGFETRAGNIIVSYAEYLYKTILPIDLAVLYQYPVAGVPVWKILISAFVLILLSGVVIWYGRKRKYIIFGWLWYLGTLVPVIGFIQIGAHAMADRYTYIPLIGIFIAIAFTAKEFYPKYKKALYFFAAFSLISLTAVSCNQIRYWKDSLSLFAHTLKVTKKNYIILSNYAACLKDAHRYDEAIKYTLKLLDGKPDSPENHNNLGSLYYETGRPDEAIEQFQLALKYKPAFPQAYYNLAIILAKQNKTEDAISCYQKAIELKPDYIEAYLNYAILLNQLRRFEEAIPVCNKGLQVEPDNVFLHGHLAMALSGAGRIDEAIKEVKYVLRVRPNDVQMYRNLGILLSQKGLTSQAIDAYKRALQIDPNEQNIRFLLEKALKESR